MNDTPREIAELVRQKIMARSGVERLMMGSGMFDLARRIVLSSFPVGLSDIEIKRRLCERYYSKEVDVEGYVEYLQRRQP